MPEPGSARGSLEDAELSKDDIDAYSAVLRIVRQRLSWCDRGHGHWRHCFLTSARAVMGHEGRFASPTLSVGRGLRKETVPGTRRNERAASKVVLGTGYFHH